MTKPHVNHLTYNAAIEALMDWINTEEYPGLTEVAYEIAAENADHCAEDTTTVEEYTQFYAASLEAMISNPQDYDFQITEYIK